MITKFKIYENNVEYKEGDYVLIDIPLIKKGSHEFMSYDWNITKTEFTKYWNDREPFAKIYLVMGRVFTPYRIMFWDDSVHDIEVGCIKRHLTSEEIDEYEAKKTALKYNI